MPFTQATAGLPELPRFGLKQSIDRRVRRVQRCARFRNQPRQPENICGIETFPNQKPELLMRESEAPERKMKRSLTAFDLTCLGIGAIIGAGIFALAGTAAAGESAHVGESICENAGAEFHHRLIAPHRSRLRSAGGGAGGCAFVRRRGDCLRVCGALLRELAAMIPVSGSAYTYSYATLGEIIAWIIGWDLILEYAVGNMAVAVGWSGYFVQVLRQSVSVTEISALGWSADHDDRAAPSSRKAARRCSDYSSTTLPVIVGHAIALESARVSHCRRGHGSSRLRNSRKRDDQHHRSSSSKSRSSFSSSPLDRSW